MKQIVLLFLVVFASVSCSSVKKTQEAINYGNYDEAIQISLQNLRSNKFKKSNQPYIVLLEDAYKKANERDLSRITFLRNDGNKAFLEEIYNLYLGLDNRQNQIKPLLPLKNTETGKEAYFKFENYTSNILMAKTELSDYLYENAIMVLNNSDSKLDFRDAYENLDYLNSIYPNYKDVNHLMNEAHLKGTNFVFVKMQNRSDKVIPIRLQKDLLNFDTYKLNDFWTVYHNTQEKNTQYNYQLDILLREINISPEQVKEKEIVVEKRIVDGWEYQKDANGEVVKDSLGKTIKIDTYKNAKCRLNEVLQAKSTQVVGQIEYVNLDTNQLLKSFPLASEFVFENAYVMYRGDKRALNKEQLKMISNKRVPFPTNEQMIFDSGENLKERIKRIVSSYKF